MKRFFGVVVCMVALLLAVSASAQDEPKFESPAKMTLQNFPGLPQCLKAAATKGDPTKEAAVIYAKLTAGCKVPMHWHTAAEQLMLVSGAARMEHQGGQPEMLSKGSYALLPSKHQHNFACSGPCEFYIVTDGAFDIHYVDGSGNEIQPEQALSATNSAKSATKSKTKAAK